MSNSSKSLINSPLQNVIRYTENTSNEGKPLVDGYVIFRDADNHSTEFLVYEDRELSNAYATVSLSGIGNAVQLSSAGELPPIFLQKKKYYIAFYSSDLVLQPGQIDNYEPNDFSSGSGDKTLAQRNLVANGQFEIAWVESREIKGNNNLQIVFPALGWEFRTNAEKDSNNTYSIPSVASQNIESNPAYEFRLNSVTSGSSETIKELAIRLTNNVASFAGEQLNFKINGINYLSGTVDLNLSLVRNYGNNGSDQEELSCGSMTFTSTRSNQILTYTVPNVDGKSIGENSDLVLKIIFPLRQSCDVGITNIFAINGNNIDITNTLYPEESTGDVYSKAYFTSLDASISDINSKDENSNNYLSIYSGRGVYQNDAGAIITAMKAHHPVGYIQQGSILKYGQSTNGIANSRLYHIFGTDFGTTGKLVYGKIDASVLSIKNNPKDGGSPASGAFTVGNMGARVSLVETKPNPRFGLKAAFMSGSDDTVRLTFLNNFAPVKTHYYDSSSGTQINLSPYFKLANLSPYYTVVPNTSMTISDNQTGTASVPAIVDITFPEDLTRIKTQTSLSRQDVGPSSYKYTANFLYYTSHTDSSVGHYGGNGNSFSVNAHTIYFKVNSSISSYIPSSSFTSSKTILTAEFTTSKSLKTNLSEFIESVNDAFEYRFVFSARPNASDYFTFGESTANSGTKFYMYFTVDGTGTDPALSGHTGIVCALLSNDTISTSVDKMIVAADEFSFNLPSASDLYGAPTSPLLDYFIKQ